MFKLTREQWQLFQRLQRKHKVSLEFLRYNFANIQKFIWYEIGPRIIIRRFAVRRENRVFLEYYHLRRVLYDQAHRKLFQKVRQNIKQWSKRITAYLRRTTGIHEYVEELICDRDDNQKQNKRENIIEQMRKQLLLLKSCRRNNVLTELSENVTDIYKESTETSEICSYGIERNDSDKPLQDNITLSNAQDIHKVKIQREMCDLRQETNQTPEILKRSNEIENLHTKYKKDEKSLTQREACLENVQRTNANFLDMLMRKVGTKLVGDVGETLKRGKHGLNENLESVDSVEEFLGFDESDCVPGMLMTPTVSQSSTNSVENSAFVSEILNEYMRVNSLETNYIVDPSIQQNHFKDISLEGIVTMKTTPPFLNMPAVPETLLKLRTVAERKQYLQKFSKNHRLSIINNEAVIYRELQRKLHLKKSKSASLLLAQSVNSSMPFTRDGWHAASFVNTDFNKYYFQMINVDDGKFSVRLKGVRGNNDNFHKIPHKSYDANFSKTCNASCVDSILWQNFKPIKTDTMKNKKLNKDPLQTVFKPCPLSYKPFQKPLDDEVAALLLAGGSMAVVRMPVIELEVFPGYGKPLNDVAKRYLQYILPYNAISQEWAEFSVSTLQVHNSFKEVENPTLESLSPSKTRKSFSFVIPYYNDRNQVLVRRVVDRSEKLDDLFKKCTESDDVSIKDFTFRQNLDESDSVLVDCADMISDMINTVAISCSENSFIKEDPDALEDLDSLGELQTKLRTQTNKTNASIWNTVANRKQNRLLCELKRLNATIIDAAVQNDHEQRHCNRDFCSLGCVCSSLESRHPLRDHCGKAKCVLECNCKTSNHSRIMRLETDGRSITTEDAFMLRRKATERLARMEKEFTSTVVLTANETLLINETHNDKKRRCARAPKRYEYFTNRDGDGNGFMPKQLNALTAIEKPSSNHMSEHVLVKDTTLDQLKHCSVNLLRLEDTSNMVAWCMVHELYKCFCKGKALEGKPFIMGREETNPSAIHNVSEECTKDCTVEKEKDFIISEGKNVLEKTENRKRSIECLDNRNDINPLKEDSSHAKYQEKSEKIDKEIAGLEESSGTMSSKICKRITNDIDDEIQYGKRKRSLEDVRRHYYQAKRDSCRRHVPIPRRMYLHINRRRRQQILSFLKSNENEETRLLLNEHVMRSVYYHQNDDQSQQQQQQSQKRLSEETKEEEKTEQLLQRLFNIPQAKLVAVNDLNEHQLDEVIELIDDDDEQEVRDSTISKVNNEKDNARDVDQKVLAEATSSALTVSKLSPPVEGINKLFSGQSLDHLSKSLEECEFPKISKTFSLNLTPANPVLDTSMNESNSDVQPSAATIMAAQKTMLALAREINMTNEDFESLYNDVIHCMNAMVCKKMYDISEAFKRDSITLPQPRSGILCIVRWSNFLTAFSQKCLFMWQVKMKDEPSFLVVTLNNMIPLVAEALGVANITALKTEKLPLIARMLMSTFHNHDTHNLGVIMQGKNTHWLVKGFIRGEAKYACFKPNPQNRPALTKKINILCCLLLRQRIREEKLKMFKRDLVKTRKKSNDRDNSPPSSLSRLNEQTDSRKRKLNSSFACINNVKVPSSLEKIGNEASKMKSNIEIRKITPNDVHDLHLPQLHKQKHKWLVLDLRNDFSHIFVPDFRELLSLDRIQKVITFARQKQKIIKMQFFLNAHFDVFITPNSGRKIYVGPFEINVKEPLLILLQSVDGQMMMRELYQEKHNIHNVDNERTTAFWLHLEVNNDNENSEEETIKIQTKANENQTIPDELRKREITKLQDDEDCVIIDDVTEHDFQSKKIRYNFTIQATGNNSTLQITTQPSSLSSDPPPLQGISQIPIKSSNQGSLAISNAKLISQDSNVVARKRAYSIASLSATLPNRSTSYNGELKPMTNPPTSSVLISKVVSLSPTFDNNNLVNTTASLNQNSIPVISNVTSLTSDTRIISNVVGSTTAIHHSNGQSLNCTQPSYGRIDVNRRRVSTICSKKVEEDMLTSADSSRKANILKKDQTSVHCVGVANKLSKLSSNIGSGEMNLQPPPLAIVSTSSASLLKRNLQPINKSKLCLAVKSANYAPNTVISSSVACNNTTTFSSINRPFTSKKLPTLSPITANQPKSTLTTSSTVETIAAVGQNNPVVLNKLTSAKSNSGNTIQYHIINPTNLETAVKNINNITVPKRAQQKVLNVGGNITTTNKLVHYKISAPPALSAGSCSTSKCIPKPNNNNSDNINVNSKLTFKQKNVEFPNSCTNLSTAHSIVMTNSTPITTPRLNIINQQRKQTGQVIRDSTSIADRIIQSKTVNSFTLARNLPSQTQISDINSANVNSAAVTTTTATTTTARTSLLLSNDTNTPPPHVKYGYVVAPGQRFISKRIKNDYYVRLPTGRIERFENMESMSTFLNKHVLQNIDDKSELSVQWKFVPASPDVQMQNYKRSLMRKKSIRQNRAIASFTPGNLTNSLNSTIVANTTSLPSINETILIED
uniref:MGA conserved domain-containing protein n=1 Tax=Glossina brevipalpis TaxID=37001 RepID=A0A1A9X4B3_9MUSC